MDVAFFLYLVNEEQWDFKSSILSSSQFVWSKEERWMALNTSLILLSLHGSPTCNLKCWLSEGHHSKQLKGSHWYRRLNVNYSSPSRWSNIRVYNVRPRYCVTLVFALHITTLSSIPITLCTKHFDMISSTPYSLVISYGSKQIAFPHWIIAASGVNSVAFLGQIPFLYTEVVCFLA